MCVSLFLCGSVSHASHWLFVSMNYDSSDTGARRGVFSRLHRSVGVFKKDRAGGGKAASVKMTLSDNCSSKTGRAGCSTIAFCNPHRSHTKDRERNCCPLERFVNNIFMGEAEGRHRQLITPDRPQCAPPEPEPAWAVRTCD